MNYNALTSFIIKKTEPEGFFQGYASTYDVDLAGDKIEKGAFQDTLEEWKQMEGHLPLFYYQHDITKPIGVFHDLYEDEQGLAAKGKFIFDLPKSKEAFRQMQLGAKGLSIGFRVLQSYAHNMVRYITKLKLTEISIVPWPCNERAAIHAFKAGDSALLCEKIRRLSNMFRHP